MATLVAGELAGGAKDAVVSVWGNPEVKIVLVVGGGIALWYIWDWLVPSSADKEADHTTDYVFPSIGGDPASSSVRPPTNPIPTKSWTAGVDDSVDDVAKNWTMSGTDDLAKNWTMSGTDDLAKNWTMSNDTPTSAAIFQKMPEYSSVTYDQAVSNFVNNFQAGQSAKTATSSIGTYVTFDDFLATLK